MLEDRRYCSNKCVLILLGKSVSFEALREVTVCVKHTHEGIIVITFLWL